MECKQDYGSKKSIDSKTVNEKVEYFLLTRRKVYDRVEISLI